MCSHLEQSVVFVTEFQKFLDGTIDVLGFEVSAKFKVYAFARKAT